MLRILVRMGVLLALFFPPAFTTFLIFAISRSDSQQDPDQFGHIVALSGALLAWSVFIVPRVWPGAWRGWLPTSGPTLTELARRSAMGVCILAMIWFGLREDYRVGDKFAGIFVALILLVLLIRARKAPIAPPGSRYAGESQSGATTGGASARTPMIKDR